MDSFSKGPLTVARQSNSKCCFTHDRPYFPSASFSKIAVGWCIIFLKRCLTHVDPLQTHYDWLSCSDRFSLCRVRSAERLPSLSAVIGFLCAESGAQSVCPLSAVGRTLCTEAVTCALLGTTRLLFAARCTVPFPSSSDSSGGKVAETQRSVQRAG